MPYGQVKVERSRRQVLIVIDLPDHGEPSVRGRAENLVDPSQWIRYQDLDEHLSVKLTVCRPIFARHSSVR